MSKKLGNGNMFSVLGGVKLEKDSMGNDKEAFEVEIRGKWKP